MQAWAAGLHMAASAAAAVQAIAAAANHVHATTKVDLRQVKEEDALHHIPLPEMEDVHHHLLRVLLQETEDVHVKKIAASRKLIPVCS